MQPVMANSMALQPSAPLAEIVSVMVALTDEEAHTKSGVVGVTVAKERVAPRAWENYS